MDVNFGNQYRFTNIAGYIIQTTILPTAGIEELFFINIFLQSRMDKSSPRFPEVTSSDILEIRQDKLKYQFPNIEYTGNVTAFTDVEQFHVLSFSYKESLTPRDKDPEDIVYENTMAPSCDPLISRGKGTISTNENGTNAAPLLGLKLFRENVNVLQIFSERCKLGGWMVPILEQNKNLCNNGVHMDLKFKLNGELYDCSDATEKDAHDLSYLYYEERFGYALDLPLLDILKFADNTQKPPTFKVLDSLGTSTYRKFIDVYGKTPNTEKSSERILEICTVVSTSDKSKTFDWRTPTQKS